MATTLRWFAGDGSPEILPAASGGFNTAGFYGGSFGFSIRVGEFNETTYRTTEDGQTDGGALPNLRWANATGAYVAGEVTATELREVNNDEATLKIRLNVDSAVGTQNAELRTYDKDDIDNPPSGVTVYAAEIRKESPSVRGSGDSAWTEIYGSGSVLEFDDRSLPATQHDFFVALSASPDSVGEKTQFAFYFSIEFI